MKNYYITLILFQFIFSFSYSQEVTGDWHGLREYPDRPLRMILHISKDDSTYSANYDSPENDLFGIKLDSFAYNGNSLYLQYKEAEISFQGIVDLKSQTITGIYYYPEGELFLTLNRKPNPPIKNGYAYLKQTYAKKEVYITMRDGVKLFTSIYSPKNKSQSLPILLWRTPYNSEPSEKGYSGRLFTPTNLVIGQTKTLLIV